MNGTVLDNVKRMLWGALVTLLLFVAMGRYLASHPQTAALPLILYFVLVTMFTRPVLSAYALEPVTEWMLAWGWTRSSLARHYLFKQLWVSVVHAWGITWLWMEQPQWTVTSFLGWTSVTPAWVVLLSAFALQVVFRSLAVMLLNIESATCIPPRIRDVLLGRPATALQAVLIWPFTGVVFVCVLAAPPLVCLFSGSTLWLAVPAAVYSMLAWPIARSVEFTRRSSAAPRARQRHVDARRARGRIKSFSPFLGLFWEGVERWPKFGAALSLFLGLVVLLPLSFGMRDWRSALVAALLSALGVLLAFLLLLGGRLFRWRSIGSSAEYLYLHGVPLQTLRRLKLLTGAAVSLLTVAFTTVSVLMIVSARERVTLSGVLAGPVLPIVGALLGHLLLAVNENPVRQGGSRRVCDIILDTLKRNLWLICVAGAVLAASGVRVSSGGPAALAVVYLIGLAIFIPATVLWIRDWLRQDDETTLKEDAFGMTP